MLILPGHIHTNGVPLFDCVPWWTVRTVNISRGDRCVRMWRWGEGGEKGGERGRGGRGEREGEREVEFRMLSRCCDLLSNANLSYKMICDMCTLKFNITTMC